MNGGGPAARRPALENWERAAQGSSSWLKKSTPRDGRNHSEGDQYMSVLAFKLSVFREEIGVSLVEG